MPIDFPTSPTTGQVYTYLGKSWVYNGTGWDAPKALSEIGAVQTFANATARTAAIPTPTEGIVSYLNDSNLLSIYDGANWKTSLGAIGGVIQVVSATNSTQATTTSTSFQDTGLTATITPRSTANRILILVTQPIRPVDNAVDQVEAEFTLQRNTTDLLTTRYGGNAVRGAGNALAFASINAVVHLDSPATTAAITYKTQHRRVIGLRSETQYENKIASIVLMEIVG